MMLRAGCFRIVIEKHGEIKRTRAKGKKEKSLGHRSRISKPLGNAWLGYSGRWAFSPSTGRRLFLARPGH